jgi:hypothetical protein
VSHAQHTKKTSAIAVSVHLLRLARVQRPALLPSYPLLFFATPLILLCAAITAAAAPRLAAAARRAEPLAAVDLLVDLENGR